DRSPDGRYQTAGAMADDLRRFLADQPVLARRQSFRERLARWCRRNPALAWAVGAAALAVLAAATFLTLFAVHDASHARDLEETLRQRDAAWSERDEADRLRRRWERTSAVLALERGVRLANAGRVREGLLWMARGLEIYPAGDPDLEFALRTNLGAWGRTVRTTRDLLEPAAP